MTRRLIDPREQIERAVHEREGIVTPRRLAERQDEIERYRDADPPVIVQETITWYRQNVGATGNGPYPMRRAVPSGDASWAMAALDVETPALGRILLVRVWASEAVTAGTITPRLDVAEGVDTTSYTFDAAQLDTTDTLRKSAVFRWAHGIQIAEGATINAQAIAAGTVAPLTIDMGLSVVMGYEID